MKNTYIYFAISALIINYVQITAQYENDNRPKVGVSVILMQEDGKILLGLRKGAHGSGTWGLPGGHLEFGESFHECATREVMEEVGLELLNLKTHSITNDIFETENKHYVTIFMISNQFSGDVQLLEPEYCERWDWFNPNDLPENLFLPLKNFLATQTQQTDIIL